jgi:hypothetical protein
VSATFETDNFSFSNLNSKTSYSSSSWTKKLILGSKLFFQHFQGSSRNHYQTNKEHTRLWTLIDIFVIWAKRTSA